MGKEAVNKAKENLDAILSGDGKKLVESAKGLGEHLALKKMSTSQIRNIFDVVKRMEKYKPYDLDITRAKLAYVAGRHKEVRDLQEVLDAAIEKINNENKFKYFKDFFEAIVAYHRYYVKE